MDDSFSKTSSSPSSETSSIKEGQSDSDADWEDSDKDPQFKINVIPQEEEKLQKKTPTKTSDSNNKPHKGHSNNKSPKDKTDPPDPSSPEEQKTLSNSHSEETSNNQQAEVGQGNLTLEEENNICIGIFDQNLHKSTKEYSKLCDQQQRLFKKNDLLKDASKQKKLPPLDLTPPIPIVEINDFKELLNLVSDQKVKQVSLGEILIGNDSLDIVIKKEKFIDSLLNISTGLCSKVEVRKKESTKKEDTDVYGTIPTEESMQYFPFNPTFQTSEEVRNDALSPDEKYLKSVDENEQKLIMDAIESSNSQKKKDSQEEKAPVTKVKKKVINKLPQLPTDFIIPGLSFTDKKESKNPLEDFMLDPSPLEFNTDNEGNACTFIDEQGDAKLSRSDSQDTNENNIKSKSPKKPINQNKNLKKIPDLPPLPPIDMDLDMMGDLNMEEVKVPKNDPPKKNGPFDFSALDNMGDMLDMDLSSNLNSEDYLSVLINNK